jgi:hypothetical protein
MGLLSTRVQTRRQFLNFALLNGALALLVFGSRLSFFTSKGRKSSHSQKPASSELYQVSFVTLFPMVLTFDEWMRVKESRSKSEASDRHTEEWIKAGKIVGESSEFLGDRSKWILTFRSKADYTTWIDEVVHQQHRSFPSSFRSITEERYLVS